MLPNPEQSRAVLLGTGNFRSDQLPDLPAVRRNLFDLDAVLTGPPDAIVAADNSTIVFNPDSPRSFIEQLRKDANQAEDFLFVYYAGHGVRHDRKERLYLATRETDPEELDGTAVPFDAVADVIENSFAQTRLVILDCCYSGLALGKMSAAAPDLQTIKIAGTTVITSSPRNEISLAPVGDRNTAFTAELLNLLRNGSPVPNAPLDVQRLFGSLRAEMARRGLPTPKMQAADTSGGLWLRRPQERPKPVAEPAGVPAPRPPETSGEAELPVVEQKSWSTEPVPAAPPSPQRKKQTAERPVEFAKELAGRSEPPKRLDAVAAIVSATLQWIGTIFFGSFGIGSLVGAIFELNGRDAIAGTVMLAIGSFFAFFLVRRLVQRLGLHWQTALGLVFPKSVRKVKRGLAGCAFGGALLSLGTTIAAITSPPRVTVTAGPSTSELALTSWLILMFGTLTVLLAYSVFRLSRR